MGMVVLRPSRKHEIVGRLDELQFPTVILKKQWRSVLYIYTYVGLWDIPTENLQKPQELS